MTKRKANLKRSSASGEFLKISPSPKHRTQVIQSVTKATPAASLNIGVKLGLDAGSRTDLAELINRRFSIETLDALRQHGFDESDISLIVPERTLRNRKKKNEPLTIEESDRAARLATIQTRAEETFGNSEKAHKWLKKPLNALSGATPMAYSRTDAGARVVENILAKILWGAAA